MLSGSFVFKYTSSNIPLCPSLVYLRESPIWKGEVRALVWVESLQTLFDGLTRGLSNLCDTASLITSSSASWVKYISLPVIVSSLAHTYEKSKLIVEYLEIYHTLLEKSRKPSKSRLDL